MHKGLKKIFRNVQKFVKNNINYIKIPSIKGFVNFCQIISGFASLAAVLLAMIAIDSSQRQFKENKDTSQSQFEANNRTSAILNSEVTILKDSTLFQFKKNGIASDSLIAQIKELQAITTNLLTKSNTIAETQLKDIIADVEIIEPVQFFQEMRGIDNLSPPKIKNTGKHSAKIINYVIAIITKDSTMVKIKEFPEPIIIKPDSSAYIDIGEMFIPRSYLNGKVYFCEYVIYQDTKLKGTYPSDFAIRDFDYCYNSEYPYFNNICGINVASTKAKETFLEKHKPEIIQALNKNSIYIIPSFEL